MKKKDFVVILGSLFVLTLLWVTFTIYHNLTTSTIVDPLSIQIIPIDGTFDTKTLAALKERQKINPDFELTVAQTTDEKLLSPTPSPIEEIASESAQTSGQSASDSGILLEGQ